MIDCGCIYEDNLFKKYRRKFIKLEKAGTVHINLKEQSFDSSGIVALVNDIAYVINLYKSGCKRFVFYCRNFCPEDKLTYILFEMLMYDLRINRGYDVILSIQNVKNKISTEGIKDSSLGYLLKSDEVYAKKFIFEQNTMHFRRIITKSQLEGAGISSVLGELKIFFLTSSLNREKTDQIAKTISELIDNVGEHTDADCLIDIDITQTPYTKIGEQQREYYAVNTVVLNLDEKKLSNNIREKVKNKYFGNSQRYQMVTDAYNNHKRFFDKHYNEEDFFNVVAFQDEISGRKYENQTGGTGLTQLIKSLETDADDHGCYVLSGNQGLFFRPELLEYNEDRWLGFNKQKDFINKRPDELVILRSNAYLRGTAYNFTLIYRKE